LKCYFKQKCCTQKEEYCQKHKCSEDFSKECKTKAKTTIVSTTTSSGSTTSSDMTTKPESSFKQVLNKCKRLWVKYFELSDECEQPKGMMSQRNVKIEYKLEENDWKNKLAGALLKTVQDQINSNDIDYQKLQISIMIDKSTGIANVFSVNSELNLPFNIKK
jgi:hypothetical protein